MNSPEAGHYPDLGGWIVEQILHFAAFWFTSGSAPGWLSLGLVAALVVLSIWHGLSAFRLRRAVSAARSILQTGNGHITGERLTAIDQGFRCSALRIVSSSCSTTTVLPFLRSARRVSSSIALSRACSPMVGSSRM